MQLSEMNGSLRTKDWRNTEKEQSTRSALIKELLQKHVINSQEETPLNYGFCQLTLQIN